MSTESLDLARSQYQAGKQAFERGAYRQSIECLEKAVSLAGRNTPLGGEAQLWLVTAYQAAGQQPQAIALCQQLEHHPDLNTRKQGRRLLFILNAPELKRRPEWMTQIPDLGAIEGATDTNLASQYTPSRPRPPRPKPEPEPIDLSQVNTQDNGFVWVALAAIGILIGGLLWFSS